MLYQGSMHTLSVKPKKGKRVIKPKRTRAIEHADAMLASDEETRGLLPSEVIGKHGSRQFAKNMPERWAGVAEDVLACSENALSLLRRELVAHVTGDQEAPPKFDMHDLKALATIAAICVDKGRVAEDLLHVLHGRSAAPSLTELRARTSAVLAYATELARRGALDVDTARALQDMQTLVTPSAP